MKVVVIYESMFGNTHAIADAIGAGFKDGNLVIVLPVARVSPDIVAGADLVVVGGPTHLHRMSRPGTRKAAVQAAGKPGSTVTLDPDAGGPGLTSWFDSLGTFTGSAAAFDTRLASPAPFTGRAALGIRKQLRQHGFSVIAAPESFLVTNANKLRPGETDRAFRWGQQLAARHGVTARARAGRG
jgi:hypothetical protein